MREKLGMTTFIVLLVAVWGVGFLWFHGDLPFGSEESATAKARPSASPSPEASPRPSPTAGPASPSATYTGSVSPAQELKQIDLNPTDVRPSPIALPPVTQWTMATFNLLGSSHTRKGGEHARFTNGPNRMNSALSILAQHQVSVVGFQEFQPDQRSAFAGRAKGWAMYPGLSLGGRAGENSVAWRLDTWELLEPGLVSIPYFNGNQRPMPYVLLRNRLTGVQAYFSTFHNPADTGSFRRQQRWRTAAESREIELFNRLEKTGIPQFVTGDMNEREEYFCRITGATPLIAAAGGSNDGRCVVPTSTQIDWIFGSPGVAFSGYTVDRSVLVRRTTDHPVVVTQVVLDALKFDEAYDPTLAPPR